MKWVVTTGEANSERRRPAYPLVRSRSPTGKTDRTSQFTSSACRCDRKLPHGLWKRQSSWRLPFHRKQGSAFVRRDAFWFHGMVCLSLGPDHMASRSTGSARFDDRCPRCLSGVIRVALTPCRPLQVCPDERTSSNRPGMPQRCQEVTCGRSVIFARLGKPIRRC